MCQLLMNNEFRKITIIALSQVDVSKKYKKNTSACQLLYTGAFVRCSALVCFYDLWALYKYQNQLKMLVCLCNIAYWCVYVRLCIDAFVRRMGTAQIPISIININAFFWYCAPVRFNMTTYQCVDTTYGHLTNPNTN